MYGTGFEKLAPGALFSNFYEADTAVMQEDPNSAGGFAVYGVKGEEGTGYKDKPLSNGVFKGIAIRNAMGTVKHTGDAVAFVKHGKVGVQVSGSDTAEADAYLDTSDNSFTASAQHGTGNDAVDNIKIGKFVTNSTAANGLAYVEIA